MDLYSTTHFLRDFISPERLRSASADEAWHMVEELCQKPASEETWNALLELMGAWPAAADVERWVEALEPKIDHWAWRLRESTLGQRHTQGDKACVCRLIGFLKIGKIDDSTGQKFRRWTGHSEWQNLRGLRLYDLEVEHEALRAFFASPYRERLEELIVQDIGRQTGAMRRLFADASLGALTDLRLISLDLRKSDLLELAELPFSGQLRLLDISGNFVYSRDLLEILQPDAFPGLEVLVVGQTEITLDELGGVVPGLAHPSLRRLEVPHTPAARTLGQDVFHLPTYRD